MMTNTDTTQKLARVVGVYTTVVMRDAKARKLTAKGIKAIRTGEYQQRLLERY
jgi:hypothetical protein